MTNLISKIEAISNLVLVDDLTVSGNYGHNNIVVSVRNFKFSNNSVEMPVQFSVVIEIDGVHAIKWDICWKKEQQEFQLFWVKLQARLFRDEMELEDASRDNAKAIWASMKS